MPASPPSGHGCAGAAAARAPHSLAVAQPEAEPIPAPLMVAAFLTYSACGYPLTASVAFPALALFNLLRFPVMMFPAQVRKRSSGAPGGFVGAAWSWVWGRNWTGRHADSPLLSPFPAASPPPPDLWVLLSPAHPPPPPASPSDHEPDCRQGGARSHPSVHGGKRHAVPVLAASTKTSAPCCSSVLHLLLIVQFLQLYVTPAPAIIPCLQAEEMRQAAPLPPAVPGQPAVELHGASFAWSPGAPPLLHDIHLTGMCGWEDWMKAASLPGGQWVWPLC